jgi:hypothetical protein
MDDAARGDDVPADHKDVLGRLGYGLTDDGILKTFNVVAYLVQHWEATIHQPVYHLVEEIA